MIAIMLSESVIYKKCKSSLMGGGSNEDDESCEDSDDEEELDEGSASGMALTEDASVEDAHEGLCDGVCYATQRCSE